MVQCVGSVERFLAVLRLLQLIVIVPLMAPFGSQSIQNATKPLTSAEDGVIS